MSTPIDWEAVPQAEYEAYTKRMDWAYPERMDTRLSSLVEG